MRVEPSHKHKRKRSSENVEPPKEKKAVSLSLRQRTLAHRLNLPVPEVVEFILDGKRTRSALVFPTLTIGFLQVKDMAQMTRVNKRWHQLCDAEIKVRLCAFFWSAA
jgi:hypothetical protein